MAVGIPSGTLVLGCMLPLCREIYATFDFDTNVRRLLTITDRVVLTRCAAVGPRRYYCQGISAGRSVSGGRPVRVGT